MFSVKKILFALALLVAPLAASAQTVPQFVQGSPLTSAQMNVLANAVNNSLKTGNAFSEIAAAATQATALANLGTVAHVPTTAALEALYPRYIGAGAVVVKDGWYAAGDMPAAEYTIVASPCPVNTYPGGGDGGGYFPAAYNPGVPGGECWELAPQAVYDARIWGVTYTGTDPNGNNGTQLTAFFTFVGNTGPSVGIPQPTLNVPGPVMVDTPVTASGAFLNGLSMSLIAGTGLAPSGGVCPAVLNITTTGTHNLDNINIDVNRVPGVDGVHDSVNGTNHFSIQVDHWEGICGSTTVTGASASAGTQIIAVGSTSGLAQFMVSRGNPGIPDRAVIADIPDTTDCETYVSAAACIVITKPTTGTVSGSLTFDTDANGYVCGYGGTNCGGTWPSVNLFEWLNNDPEVGQAAYRYGAAFLCTGSTSAGKYCNDIAIDHGLIQEGVASFAMTDGAGGAHLKDIEFNNNNYGVSAKGTATFVGAAMTLTGVTGTPLIGDVVSGTGITGSPTILSGSGGSYVLSASPGIAGPITVTTTTPGYTEVNSPCVLLLSGATEFDLQSGAQVNGCSIQEYATRSTGPESSPPQVIINSTKATASNNVTLTPNALVQLYTTQAFTNFSTTQIDPLTITLGSIGALWGQFGAGTIGQGQSPNEFDFYGAVLDNFLFNQESYTTSTSLALSDCAQSITTNNNSGAITLTVADTITNVGPASSCYYWVYTQGNYPVTVAAASAATFNNLAGPITLAQNTQYLIKTTGVPGSSLNWSVSPPPLLGNAPATMTSSTGNTIGQLNIVKGTITRSNCGAALTDTTATATQIENALPAGYDFINGGPPNPLRYINTCSYPVTIAGGTGVTPVGNNVVPANSQADFVFTVTGIYPTPTMNMTASSVVHGQLIGVQSFSSTSCSSGCTYTPDVGTNEVIVDDIGAGGGAAGAVATSTGQSAIGMGGGAGSYGSELFTTGFSGVTVTVPAGGAGGSAGAAGTAGSAATFGALLSCPGGMPGTATTAKSAAALGGVSGKAAACTFGTGTTLANIPGATSEGGIVLTAGSIAQSGMGANSPMGSGGSPVSSATANGNNASGFGAGGSGGSNASASEATATNGGNGSPAEELVYEYN